MRSDAFKRNPIFSFIVTFLAQNNFLLDVLKQEKFKEILLKAGQHMMTHNCNFNYCQYVV